MTNICRPDLNLGFCFAEKPEKIFPKSRFGSCLLKVRKFCIPEIGIYYGWRIILARSVTFHLKRSLPLRLFKFGNQFRAIFSPDFVRLLLSAVILSPFTFSLSRQ